MKKVILIVLLTLIVLLMGFSPIIKAAGSSQEQQNMEVVKKVSGDPGKYWVGSPGSDGKFQGFDQKGTWKFEEGEKGQDIVLANGDFTYKPDLEEKK